MHLWMHCSIHAKVMLPTGSSQPITKHSKVLEPDHFWPTQDSANRQSLLRDSIGHKFLRAIQQTKGLPTQSSSFPLSFHKCQTYIVVWRLYNASSCFPSSLSFRLVSPNKSACLILFMHLLHEGPKGTLIITNLLKNLNY